MVKCWGENNEGQLGYGNAENMGDNDGEMGDYLAFVDLDNEGVISLAVGMSFSCSLHYQNPQMRCWGDGSLGQLGSENDDNIGDDPNELGIYLPPINLGENVKYVSQITCGMDHVLIITDNGFVKAWGNNYHGQLGLGDNYNRGDDSNEMGNQLEFLKLGSDLQAIEVSAGVSFSCAKILISSSSSNELKCWGFGEYGMLGSGNDDWIGNDPNEMGDYLPFINLPSFITSSSDFTITSGFFFFFLSHFYINFFSFTQLLLFSLGHFTTGIITQDGLLAMFGKNHIGQLGYEDNNHRGDNPSDLGENLQAVNLGTSRSVIEISSGDDHSCALLDNLLIKCWGYGSWGQLGYEDGSSRGSQPNSMGNNLPYIDLGSDQLAYHVIAGRWFTCAILQSNNQLKCWGENQHGQLGYGDTLQRGGSNQDMGLNLDQVEIGCELKVQICFDYSPTLTPSHSPSNPPTFDPTYQPTFDPSFSPTNHPTDYPSSQPTQHPSISFNPSFDPSFHPTAHPTLDPTFQPTNDPSQSPTAAPTVTFSPTDGPTVISISDDDGNDDDLGGTIAIGCGIGGGVILIACVAYFTTNNKKGSHDNRVYELGNIDNGKYRKYCDSIIAKNYTGVRRLLRSHGWRVGNFLHPTQQVYFIFFQK